MAPAWEDRQAPQELGRLRGVVSALRVAMEDAQFPPEAGEVKGAPVRRSGMRLRDAETVAATRLDMFGDNSLRETLAGAPGTNEGEAAGDAAEPVVANTAVDVSPPDIPQLPVVEAAPQPSLPVHLESAAFEPVAADVARDLHPGDVGALQIGLPEPEAPVPALPAPSAPHSEVFSIFNALDTAERRAETEWNGKAEPGSIEDLLVPPQELRVRLGGDAVLNGAAPWDAEASPRTVIEALEMPPFREDSVALSEPALHNFSPPFPDSSVDAGPFRPSGPPPFREELAPPTPMLDAAAPSMPMLDDAAPSMPVLDAAAQIAAEADATAQALENLQRLLESKLPDEPTRPVAHSAAQPDRAFGAHAFSPPPMVEGMRIGPQTEAHSLAGTMAPMLPLRVPSEFRSGRGGIYLLGFLSGLGLSLMTGIVLYFILYFVINTTG
jgi:hypothetical protein